MKDNRDFDGSKLDDAEIKLTVSNPILKWLDNFWYHHKWKVIVSLFFAVVIIVGIVQMIGKKETDATVLFAVPETVYADKSAELGDALRSLMVTDPNGDGKKEIVVMTYPIYSEDEMNEANEAETNEEGRYVIKVDRSYNVSKFEEYTEYMKTGECSILFVSEYLYENLKIQDRLRPISDLFPEEIPEGTLSDGYGVRLGDTYLYEFFDAFKVLPEDTVICLARSYVWGASSDEEKYAHIEDYFKTIVSFSE